MNFASRDKAKKDNLAMHRMSFDINDHLRTHFRSKEERDHFTAEMLRQCIQSDFYRLQAEMGTEAAKAWLYDFARLPF